MTLLAKRTKQIAAKPDTVWGLVSDIKNVATVISAIKMIEVLEVPSASSMVGTKWKETREWMGRDAVEVMWVTEAHQHFTKPELKVMARSTIRELNLRKQPLVRS
jgi:hypothetical protein